MLTPGAVGTWLMVKLRAVWAYSPSREATSATTRGLAFSFSETVQFGGGDLGHPGSGQNTNLLAGQLLVLDLHSYNHRRDGAGAEAAPVEENPDIDIGATTLDRGVFGDLLGRFTEELGRHTMRGNALQIGENVRYPDGGNFPEWLFETYGKRTCVITLEYKKIFMDEWTGTLDIGAAQDLRTGLMHALGVARTELAKLNR